MEAYGLSSTQLSFWLGRLNHRRDSIRSMGRLMGWYELAVDPLLNSDSISEPSSMFSRLRWLRDQLSIWLPGADERQAADCFLCFLELSLLPIDNTEPDLIEELLDVIEEETRGEQSALMQSYTRIVLAGLFTDEPRFNLSHSRFLHLLEQVPSGRGNPELWWGAALWAYQNRHEDVLEQALEYCVIGYPSVVDEYIWRLCNLMYRLQSNRAISKDVEKLINSCMHPVQLLQFREVLLDDCRRAGLVNRELLYWLERREQELQREPLTVLGEQRVAG